MLKQMYIFASIFFCCCEEQWVNPQILILNIYFTPLFEGNWQLLLVFQFSLAFTLPNKAGFNITSGCMYGAGRVI